MSSAESECAFVTPSVKPGRGRPSTSAVPSAVTPSWRIRTFSGGEQQWDWVQGRPPIRDLVPARRPAADSMSRHTPVHMACQTTGGSLLLESGLEYELARELDRDPSVTWLVAQPVLLGLDGGTRHVPDLLAEHRAGRVVVWDARPIERRDADFLRVAELTAQACIAVGWEYALYDTADTARRLNLMWLTTYRHRPEWPHATVKALVLERAAAPISVGELMRLDDGDGHLIAVMWHLLWVGELVADLNHRISEATLVHTSGEPHA